MRTQVTDHYMGLGPFSTLSLHSVVKPMITWPENRQKMEPVQIAQAWGLLSQFPPFRYFPHFSGSWKHRLIIEYHVYIWQVAPQLSCGDTCQIWMWFKEYNRQFCKIRNFAYGEINERIFSNPHPRLVWIMLPDVSRFGIIVTYYSYHDVTKH